MTYQPLINKVAGFLLVLIPLVVLAQSGGTADWGGTTAAYARSGVAMPGICFAGQIFVNRQSNPGFYYCEGGAWVRLGAQYDVNATYNGTPGASAVGVRFVAARPFRSLVHTNGDPASGAALVAATAQKDFVWAKNGTAFCTFRFAAAGTTATYQSCTVTSLAVGDVLTVTAPATPDSTLANIGLTLPGVLN